MKGPLLEFQRLEHKNTMEISDSAETATLPPAWATEPLEDNEKRWERGVLEELGNSMIFFLIVKIWKFFTKGFLYECNWVSPWERVCIQIQVCNTWLAVVNFSPWSHTGKKSINACKWKPCWYHSAITSREDLLPGVCVAKSLSVSDLGLCLSFRVKAKYFPGSPQQTTEQSSVRGITTSRQWQLVPGSSSSCCLPLADRASSELSHRLNFAPSPPQPFLPSWFLSHHTSTSESESFLELFLFLSSFICHSHYPQLISSTASSGQGIYFWENSPDTYHHLLHYIRSFWKIYGKTMKKKPTCTFLFTHIFPIYSNSCLI